MKFCCLKMYAGRNVEDLVSSIAHIKPVSCITCPFTGSKSSQASPTCWIVFLRLHVMLLQEIEDHFQAFGRNMLSLIACWSTLQVCATLLSLYIASLRHNERAPVIRLEDYLSSLCRHDLLFAILSLKIVRPPCRNLTRPSIKVS